MTTGVCFGDVRDGDGTGLGSITNWDYWQVLERCFERGLRGVGSRSGQQDEIGSICRTLCTGR
jgi:hypothetical protein